MVRGAQAQDLFNQIMGKTMTLMIVSQRQLSRVSESQLNILIFQKNVETYIQDCYDTIAMFLCVQLILRYQIMCHKRCVPALDKWVLE